MSNFIGKPTYNGWHGMHGLSDCATRQNFVGSKSYIFGMSATRQICAYEVDDTNFVRLLGVNKNTSFSPGLIGTDGGRQIQISPDLRFLAASGTVFVTPEYAIFRLSDFDFTAYAPLQTNLSGNGNANAFSANSAYWATGDSGTKLYVYNVTDTLSASGWTNVTNKTQAGASWRSVVFSPNNTWLVGGGGKDTGTNQYIKIFLQSDWSEVAAPTQPAGVVYDIAFSADSSLCAVAHATTPFLTVYDTSSTPWTKKADVATLPGAKATSVSFLGNSYLCVGHDGSGYKNIYKVSDWSKLSTPFNAAPAAAGTARYSPDGTMLAVVANPYLYVYDISGETYTQRTTSPTTAAPYILNLCWLQAGATNTY